MGTPFDDPCTWTGACNWLEFRVLRFYDMYGRAAAYAEDSQIGWCDEQLEQIEIGVTEFRKTHDELHATRYNMTLLIPDRTRENREDFIWCVPITRDKWNKWYGLSEKFKAVTPPEHGAVRYMNRMEGREVRTVLLMPNGGQSDEDVEHAGAYLRMVKGLSCRMYVVRCSDDPPTGARLIHAVAGVDPKQVQDVDFDSVRLASRDLERSTTARCCE